MSPAALAAIALLLQEAPQVINAAQAAQAAADITEEQLQQLLDSEHQAIAEFGAAVQAAKTSG
jgi:hypothetical protein